MRGMGYAGAAARVIGSSVLGALGVDCGGLPDRLGRHARGHRDRILVLDGGGGRRGRGLLDILALISAAVGVGVNS